MKLAGNLLNKMRRLKSARLSVQSFQEEEQSAYSSIKQDGNKKPIVHTVPEGNKYTKVTEYTKGVISPLAFPELGIAIEQLLLF